MDINTVIDALEMSRTRLSGLRWPAQSGVYSIYVHDIIALEPFTPEVHGLIYIGSANDLDQRGFETHFTTGKTGRSTLRRSLGALLKEILGLRAIPRSGTGSAANARNFTFDLESEERLSRWMDDNLEAGFCPVESDHETIEESLIAILKPLLNLTGWNNPNRPDIMRLRGVCADEARAMARV
jgi:hypothetical protein